MGPFPMIDEIEAGRGYSLLVQAVRHKKPAQGDEYT